MRKGQDRKVKIAGRGSALASAVRAGCLGLLALMLTLVNPVGLSAFAEEVGENDGLTTDIAMSDDDIDTQASTPSTVTISFSPSSASGSVTPVDTTTGDKAKVDVQASVRVQNSGGYKVYVGSSSSELKNGTNTIPSVTAATTYANLPINRWGYSFRTASSSTDKTVTDSYVAMPATLRSSALYSNTSTNITDETKYFMLSFAARIGSDKPAGTYSNSVTLSVVSSPLEIAIDDWGIANMQEMTSAICANAKDTNGDGENATQLKDTRDNKFYWVSKLADGKCWMTQNLDLDLSTKKKLTTTDSDVPTAGYTPAYNTVATATSTTILADSTGQRSWSLGDYRITSPYVSSNCNAGNSSAADCTSQFTPYSTSTSANGNATAHYILGNHYQWNAATAGTGSTIISGQATNSICPKGWRLPTSTSSGEFQALVTALGASSDVTKLTQAPFYGVRGGYVGQSDYYLFSYAGNYGSYWSSTPQSSADYAYGLYFYNTESVFPSYDYMLNRSNGLSVRCVAR